MDDLIAFLIGLLEKDLVLKSLFDGPVYVKAARGEVKDQFPSIVVSGSQGKGLPVGEGGYDYTDGWLRTITNVRSTPDNPGPDQLSAIKDRVSLIVNGSAVDNIPGLNGISPPSASGDPVWYVSVCREMTPSGPRDDEDTRSDPSIYKYQSTYKVMMYRVS